MDALRSGTDRRPWIVGGAVLAVVIAGLIGLAVGAPDGQSPADATPSSAAHACGGVEAQSIDLDRQVVQPEPRTCFVLDERLQVTVGAAALQPDDAVVLTVRDMDGAELASASSDSGWDPEVALTLEAGTYIVEVTGSAGATPPFLLYTATFPAGEEQPAAQVELPDVERCGDDVPLVADDAPVSVPEGDATVHHACLIVDEPAFVKVGLATAEPSKEDSPDLQLALYRAGDEATLVRTADDAIGYDPEMSVQLEPGTYVLEATAWFDGPTGAFQIYADTDADLFRHGEVTSLHAAATRALCDDAPALEPGDAITIEGERMYACARVDEAQRLVLEAATLADQDLVLEVIGFEDSGTPYRLAWADGDPRSDALASTDPALDQTLPAGTWLVAVTTYTSEAAADYDLRLAPAAGA